MARHTNTPCQLWDGHVPWHFAVFASPWSGGVPLALCRNFALQLMHRRYYRRPSGLEKSGKSVSQPVYHCRAWWSCYSSLRLLCACGISVEFHGASNGMHCSFTYLLHHPEPNSIDGLDKSDRLYQKSLTFSRIIIHIRYNFSWPV